jgi:Zn-dependent protease with chaperone function
MAEPRPTDRTPFFEFQARNRPATWRLTVACALVVGGCGFVSAIGFAVNVFLLLFASLPVGLLWRSRRYLADATAVELTRNPTGLYRGLRHLGETGAVIPGSEAVAHLFIVGPVGDRAQRGTFTEREGLLMGMHPSLTRRLARLVRMGANSGVRP